MAEYIGSRISLISKRDIRYVGKLHEISSENSTVALEQVKSFGTEDRHPSNSDTFVPAGDHVYEYIVFRGSDVKDLRIEKEPEPPKQQVPDDPAILGNARPPPQVQDQRAPLGPSSQQNQQQSPPFDQQGPQRFPQQPQNPYGYYPPNNRFGPPGPPHGFPPYGYPGMQYGAPPPGWPYPSGQGFPRGPAGQFNGGFGFSQDMPGPPGQGPPSKPQTPAEAMGSQAPPEQLPAEPNEKATVRLPASSGTLSAGKDAPAPPPPPPPPTESKPPVSDALAPPATASSKDDTSGKTIPTGPRSGRILPAIPMMSPAQKPKQPVNGNLPAAKSGDANSYAGKAAAAVTMNRPGQVPSKSGEDANRDARAAVAAAMAKLPPAQGQPKKATNGEGSAIDNLTNKVNEMRTNDNIRNSRQPGTGGYATGNRGGRGGYRGGRPRTTSQTKTVEVPKADYDFASANAKFNKEDLKKEAAGGNSDAASPVTGENGTSTPDGSGKASEIVVIPSGPGYNKASSFFDDISSESKDRQDPSGQRMGGREFRNEERTKNLDTFGQGSVDNGYRGGYRGRGRGRGFRGGGRGRGAPRGHGGPVTAEG